MSRGYWSNPFEFPYELLAICDYTLESTQTRFQSEALFVTFHSHAFMPNHPVIQFKTQLSSQFISPLPFSFSCFVIIYFQFEDDLERGQTAEEFSVNLLTQSTNKQHARNWHLYDLFIQICDALILNLETRDSFFLLNFWLFFEILYLHFS